MSQTPASKKFLQPSSSSRTQHASSSARRTPFARPPQSSSSPYPRTPFATRAPYQDDIETSFNDETESPLADTARQKPSHTRRSQRDLIEESGDVDDGQRATTPSSPILHVAGRHTEADFPDIRDHAVDASRADFSSPLPKRQKRSHDKQVQKDRIRISSSPDSTTGDTDDGHHSSESEVIDHETHGRQDDGSSEIEDGHLSRSRFRVHPATDADNKNKIGRPHPRGVFKGTSSGGTAWSEAPLPVTFSPSKRRGKYEYLYNGAAETVRGWILDIANQQSKATELSVEKVNVTHIMQDVSGRFQIARDEKGQSWMLVNQDDQKAILQTNNANGPPAQRSLALKGSGTTWTLETHEGVDRLGSKQVNVAVLWEPMTGG